MVFWFHFITKTIAAPRLRFYKDLYHFSRLRFQDVSQKLLVHGLSTRHWRRYRWIRIQAGWYFNLEKRHLLPVQPRAVLISKCYGRNRVLFCPCFVSMKIFFPLSNKVTPQNDVKRKISGNAAIVSTCLRVGLIYLKRLTKLKFN